MKKVIAAFCLCLAVFLFSVLSPVSTHAVAPIDPDRVSSITLTYRHNGSAFDGLAIKTYRIADVSAEGAFTLAGAFADYPVGIYPVASQAEWSRLSSTLAAYAVADSLEPTCTATTDETGTVVFADILPGLYLTLSVRAETNEEITVFQDLLTAVPYESDAVGQNYDVTAYPKCESYTPAPGEIEYKVVKQWKDTGTTANRPQTIIVDILKDGVLQSTQTLSSDNHWSYSWKAADDGGKWNAVERDIPDGYTVTVVENGNTMLITNAYAGGDDTPPQTGDTTVLWPYVLAMCLSGGVIVILATWHKRTEA